MTLPIESGGLGIPNLQEFWSCLKLKLLVKTVGNGDPYACIFNEQLRTIGYENFEEVDKMPPTTIMKVAREIGSNFWSDAIETWAAVKIGFSVKSKQSFLDSNILGNPAVGIDFDKRFKIPAWNFYNQDLMPLHCEQIFKKFKTIKVGHLLGTIGVANYKTVSTNFNKANTGQSPITSIEYKILEPWLKRAAITLNELKTAKQYSDMLTWHREHKGTKHSRDLLKYTYPSIENMYSMTSSWNTSEMLSSG